MLLEAYCVGLLVLVAYGVLTDGTSLSLWSA